MARRKYHTVFVFPEFDDEQNPTGAIEVQLMEGEHADRRVATGVIRPSDAKLIVGRFEDALRIAETRP